MRKNEFYSKWRKELVEVLPKYRDMTPTFKREILDCKREVFICEDHFEKEDIVMTPESKKTLRDLALPTRNLPEKMFEKEMKARKLPAVRLDNSSCCSSGNNDEDIPLYKDLNELRREVTK